MKRQTDARGNSVCFNYDALNRQTTKTARTNTANCAGGTVAYTATYGYDAWNGTTQFGRGRRTSMSDTASNTSSTWFYDSEGQLQSSGLTIPTVGTYNTSFTYDAMGRVMTTTYPDGEVVTSTYNNQGVDSLVGNISGTPTTFINGTNTFYNAASQIDSLEFGNGAVTDYTYNAQNLRLTDIVTTKSGATLLDLDYTFDNVGNVLTVKDNIGTGGLTTYAYDDLNRLMSATATLSNTYTRSWTYTTIGNIQTRNDGGGALTYTYDPNHKHAVKQVSANYFCYDANGNMTRRNSNASCTSGDVMTYDVENRLTSMTVGATTTNFAYNGDGVRVKREVVGVGTTYYVGNHYEIYKVGATTTFNKYYYFGSQRIAARIGSTLPNNGTLFYMQGDHLGSSSLLMTSGGALNTRQTYYPFGAKRVFEGSALPTDYTFTGQKSDDSTGLIFYNARYYDATLGRFTQADTIVPNVMNPQSWNRYAYTLNNPVRYTDPTGHMVKDEDGGGGGGGDGGGGDGGGAPIVVTPETANQYYHPPVDTGEPQYPNGKACWPNCWREDGRGEDGGQTNQAIIAGSGAFCFRCRYMSNEAFDIGKEPLCKGSIGSATSEKGACGGGQVGGGGGGTAPVSNPTGNGNGVVYRGLAPGENPGAGISARNPNATNSPISHVAGKTSSQWISTSWDRNVATRKYGKYGVAEIDLSKISTNIVDFSNGIPGRIGSMLSNWAKADKEVLIQSHIPADAIMRVFTGGE